MASMTTKGVKGLLIVIYGANNIGKTTQAKKLVDWLSEQGYPSEYLKYPVYHSSTGKRISSILREGKEPDISETDFQTIYYENRKEFEPELKKKLDAEVIIVAECTLWQEDLEEAPIAICIIYSSQLGLVPIFPSLITSILLSISIKVIWLRLKEWLYWSDMLIVFTYLSEVAQKIIWLCQNNLSFLLVAQ